MARLRDLNPFQRHKRLIDEAQKLYGEFSLPHTTFPVGKTDEDILKDTYRFLRDDEDPSEGDTWEQKLARTYYSKLFREYAIIDLSRYKTGEFGCRWRTKQEVIEGTGQFSCAATSCDSRLGLETYEVPFGYSELGVHQRALVKVRLCQKHALRLNYTRDKRKRKSSDRKEAKRKRKHSEAGPADSGKEGKKPKESSLAAEEISGEGSLPGSASKSPKPTTKDREAQLQAQVNEFLAQLLP